MEAAAERRAQDQSIYLRDPSDPSVVWRSPPPPTVVEAGGKPALSLLLFRYPMEQDGVATTPIGGGAIHCTLDVGATSVASDGADLEALAGAGPLASLRRLPFVEGEVALLGAGSRLASAPISAGPRCVAALSAMVSPEVATMFSQAASSGSSVLTALVDARLEMPWSGPETRLEVDRQRSWQLLRMRFGEAVAAREIAAAVDLLVSEGAVRWTAIDPADFESSYNLLRATVAGNVFGSPQGDRPAAAIPGLTQQGSFSIQPGGSTLQFELRPGRKTGLTFFAAATLPPFPPDIVQMELPASRVQMINVELASPEDVRSASVRVEFPDGTASELRLGPEQPRARAWGLRPEGKGLTYRYQASVLTADGAKYEGGPYESSYVGLSIFWRDLPQVS